MLVDFGGSLRAAKRGDEEAFATIWREFQPGLLRYLRIKAAPAAEDLAADTWFRVLKALPSFDGDESGFRAWLYTAARNRLTDWYRAGDLRPLSIDLANLAVLPASNNVESEADEHSATERSLALIARLPPDQGEVVMLRIVAGLSVPVTAEIMGRSPGATRVLCHRGLRRLQEMLSEAPVGAGTSSFGMVAMAPTPSMPEMKNA